MHLNRKTKTTKLLSICLGATFMFLGASQYSNTVQADDQASISNFLVAATLVEDSAHPHLELDDRILRRLGRCDEGTIIIFDLRRCPLCFEHLSNRQRNRLYEQYGENADSLYEVGVSQEIVGFFESAKILFPGLSFALRGFPFVGAEFPVNSTYQPLLDAVDAFIPDVASESDAIGAYEMLLPIASGRPIITGFDSVDSSSQEVDPDSDQSTESHASEADITELVQGLTESQAMSLIQASWGEGASTWDLNNDGSVSGMDLAILMNYFSEIQDESGESADSGGESDSNDESGTGDAGSDDGGSNGSGSDGTGSDGIDDTEDEADDSDESADDSGIETLIPGNGFTSPTNQPGVQGSSHNPGYTAKAIARWTELPYITRSEDFYVTVSAFHMSDIKRVDFILDGGQRVRTHEVAPHPETGYAEYMAKIDVSLLTTGLHEVRAIAYPFHGEPRVLQGEYVPGDANLHDVNNGNCSFWFQYDPSPNVVTVGGPQGQFETIDEAIQSVGPAIYGGRIELAPGTHFWLSQWHNEFLNTNERKVLTVTRAPGSDREDVIIRSSGTRGHGRGLSIHIKGVTVLTEEMTEDSTHNIFQGLSNQHNRIFFEDLFVTSIDDEYGWGLLSGHQRLAKPETEWKLGCWFKDLEFSNIAKGVNGVTMAKHVKFDRISADAFGGSPGVVVNVHVDRADPYNANHTQHADIVQFTAANGVNVENRIFADIVATNHYTQVGHLNGHPMKNFAFVRWSIDSKYRQQSLNWMKPLEHVVVDSCTFKNSRINFCSTVSKILVRNTYMYKLETLQIPPEQVFDLSTCLFDNFRIAKSHSLPGASSGEVTFATESAPAGSFSDGSDGFIPTILSINASNYSPFDGNLEIERRDEITNHYYYEASAFDFSWED
ncbi:MAG: hypothetical protein CMJ33_10025 [Phycisphaerae bacterium]|nr:hypothetical protein [Phycisphaerae bacterium]